MDFAGDGVNLKAFRQSGQNAMTERMLLAETFEQWASKLVLFLD